MDRVLDLLEEAWSLADEILSVAMQDENPDNDAYFNACRDAAEAIGHAISAAQRATNN